MKYLLKTIIAGIIALILILSGCDLLGGIDPPGGSAELLITNNSTDDNIVIHFGDYPTRNAAASAQPVPSGSDALFYDAPLGSTVHIWYTHTDGSTNYTTRLVSAVTGDTFEFLFEAGESYELIIDETSFSFIHNGVDINAPQIAAPEFSVPEGTYGSSFSLSMSTSEGSGSIYYTLDGSDPTSSSTRNLYLSAINISTTTTVRAVTRVFPEYSAESVATYTIVDAIDVDISPVPYSTETNASPIEFSITFGGEVSGLSESDFVISNGTVSSLSTADNIVFSLFVTPDGEGDVVVSLPADSVTNSESESNLADSFTIEYDGTPPAVTINGPGESPYYYSLIEFEVLVDEDTGDFLSESDISITNGTFERRYEDFDHPSGLRFVVEVVPSLQGNVSIQLDADVFRDDAGNGNALTASPDISYVPLGEVTELTASGDPRWVYAVDNTQHHLVKIDVDNQKIDSLIDLPYNNPVSIGYSPADDSLYIAYGFNDQISRYDLGTSTFSSDFDYDSGEETLKTQRMEIAPVSRRIYLLTQSEDLIVIDMCYPAPQLTRVGNGTDPPPRQAN
jgi:hypothetical protein